MDPHSRVRLDVGAGGSHGSPRACHPERGEPQASAAEGFPVRRTPACTAGERYLDSWHPGDPAAMAGERYLDSWHARGRIGGFRPCHESKYRSSSPVRGPRPCHESEYGTQWPVPGGRPHHESEYRSSAVRASRQSPMSNKSGGLLSGNWTNAAATFQNVGKRARPRPGRACSSTAQGRMRAPAPPHPIPARARPPPREAVLS